MKMEAKLIHETPTKTQLWASFYQEKNQKDKDFFEMVRLFVKDYIKTSKINKQNSYIVFYLDNRIISKIDINTL